LGQTQENVLARVARRVYRAGSGHRWACAAAVTAAALVGVLIVARVPMREDITAMLPDSDPAFMAGYRLLEAAPFTRSILIDLEAPEPEQVSVLTETAGLLEERLGPPLVSRVIGGLPMEAGANLIDWLYAHMPQLFTEQDAAALAPQVAPARVAETLGNDLQALAGPEGLWLRRWLARDPLGFRNQVLRKLGAVALMPDVQIEQGYLIDPTGRHLLLIAETPISMGDSKGGAQLLRYLDGVLAQTVPETIRAHVVCAHRYTVANARAVKRDLVVVFAVSSLSLAVIFLVMLRHWRAVFVFAVPSLAVLAGVLVAAGLFKPLSAIVVGFGAVLLGISDDYGLHVFYTLRKPGVRPEEEMAALGVPMAVSFATTVAVFIVLLWSAVPIQRQLAVLSIAGLIVALALAMGVLPHWVGQGRREHWLLLPKVLGGHSRWVTGAWLAAMLICLPWCFRVTFEGDLRSIGLMPRDVLADEFCVRDVWGDPRGRALVVVRNEDEESALRTNEQVYAELSATRRLGEFVSVAPLLPSRATQSENLARWERFWREQGRLDRLKEALDTHGPALGFSQGAFTPFLQWIEQKREPFGPADLREAAGPLLEPVWLSQPTGLGLINLVSDSDQADRAASLSGLALPPGAQAVSQKQFAATLRRLLHRDFVGFLLGALGLVVLVLAVTLRSLKQVVLCLLPAITGVVVMLALMGLLGLRMNLFNIAAGVLVLGLSIDYGAFMLYRSSEQDGVAERSVVTSALTTISSFGALSLARHPAMFSLGITVFLGLLPSMICAVFVIPALQDHGAAN
jgi:predicted exporter